MQNKIIITIFLFICIVSKTLSQTTINFATGPEGGVYFSLGWGIKTAIEKSYPDITIALNESSGSVDNAWAISNNEIQLALMQEDIATNFFCGENMFIFPSECMQAIAALYPEIVHIIVRKELEINSVYDLKGKIVSTGQENSGTQMNARSIIEAAGLQRNDLILKSLTFEQATNSILDKSVDAAFFTSGIPNGVVANLAPQVKFISLDDKVIASLEELSPIFKRDTIPANTYQHQTSPVVSAGFPVLLVCRKDLDYRIVNAITSSLFNNHEELVKSHIIAERIDFDRAYNITAVPLHKGARMYYEDTAKIAIQYSDYMLDIISYAVLIILIIFTFFRRKKFIYYFSRNQYFQIAVSLGILFTLGTLGTYWCEKSVNNNFDNIVQTFWTTIIYLLSGFEGNNPITVGGKISSILILIGSVGLLGSVIGHFTSIFIRESKNKMPVDLKKHIAICYWNSRGDTIVRELRNSEKAANKEIIILHGGNVNEKELRNKHNYYKNVFFIEGDPTSSNSLSDARVPFAESIIILSNSNESNPDPLTILTCLAINKLCEKGNETIPHIIAELTKHENRDIAIDAGASEVVSAGFYRTGIMLQSALYPQLSDIFHELLRYAKNTTSVFIVEPDHYHESLLDHSFADILELFNKHRKDGMPVIPIGIRRKGKVLLNPLPGNGEDILINGDGLVVLAKKIPDLSEVKF